MLRRRTSILPGFGLSLGYTSAYLGLIVLIPLATLVTTSMKLSWSELIQVITHPRVLASLKLTFGAALIAAVINLIFGFLLAWVLVRYSFPGKRIADALVDIPFSLPTAVSGIALTALYAPDGWLGKPLGALGIKAAFTPLGIVIALIFIGMPFVVRTLQPAIQELGYEVEEAAASLGASRWQTFTKVILPGLVPACLTGFALAFARGIGEYGSVVFIAGNMPMRTEITSLLIISKLEQFDYPGAAAIAMLMLVASFVLLFGLNFIQWWSGHRSTQRAAKGG